MDKKNPYLDYEKRCRRLIAKHGHMVQMVGAAGWAYTIGLSPARDYELICVGLPTHVVQPMLNALAELLARGLVADGVPIDEVATVPVKLVTHDMAENPELEPLLGMAYRLGYRPKRVRQMLWPDAEGRFPGDAGYKIRSQNLHVLAGEQSSSDPDKRIN